jgi:nucleotide-binding universal stress UspA family protein
MSFRDILAVVASPEADAHVLSFAGVLAKPSDAYLSALVVGWQPVVPMVVEGMVISPHWDDTVQEERERLEGRREQVAKRLTDLASRGVAHGVLVDADNARSTVGLYARHSDLAIVGRPAKDVLGDVHTPLIEGALFDSGRPVLVVPPGWRGSEVGQRIVVCWNAGREAARALADATPLLAAASSVVVVTVDAKPSASRHGEMPGIDIATHLARRGIPTEVRNTDSLGRSDAQAVLDEARAAGADLIVMGGYGRSRLSEMVFGGMTRDMLARSPLPLLLSH